MPFEATLVATSMSEPMHIPGLTDSGIEGGDHEGGDHEGANADSSDKPVADPPNIPATQPSPSSPIPETGGEEKTKPAISPTTQELMSDKVRVEKGHYKRFTCGPSFLLNFTF